MDFKEVRKQHVKVMHEIVTQFCNDENLIMLWLSYGCPDCPQEDDFDFIADDIECYTDAVNIFNSIMVNELSGGEVETPQIQVKGA